MLIINFANLDSEALVLALESQRQAQNMSYQNVADACGVSQSTIMRVFKRQSEPSLDLLQKIAAAVKYDPPQEPVVLTGYTQDAYIDYLQRAWAADKLDYAQRISQMEADRNRERAEARRSLNLALAIIAVFVLAVCALFIYDFTHSDRGWFQMDAAYYSGAVEAVLQTVRSWLNI